MTSKRMLSELKRIEKVKTDDLEDFFSKLDKAMKTDFKGEDLRKVLNWTAAFKSTVIASRRQKELYQ